MWLRDVVEEFWSDAGGPEPFPRSLEQPVLWALPLAVLKLPRLWVRDVEDWLKKRGAPFTLDCADRPLRGCVVAYRGRGCVLLDGSDPDNERRFSLAHEVGHFIADYLRPRGQAVARLSPAILEVLDGLRSPTIDERVHAVLTDVSIGVHTHLMERQAGGILGCSRVLGAEGHADRLALELLAPACEVRRRLAHALRRVTYRDAVQPTLETLVGEFGLPPSVAEPYAKFIVRSWRSGPSFREWLGLSE